MDAEITDRAAVNLAIEEAIFLEKVGKNVLPTIRFWRDRRAVIIGYSQSAEAEVNLPLCRDEGVEVVRRFSGGGAVYHDLGNLNYSIAVEDVHPLVKGLDIRESYEVLCSGVAEGVKEFDVDLIFDPPSDLLVGNRKVSGNAQSRKRDTIFHHGTLLVSADLNLLAKALRSPQGGSAIRTVTSKERPVTNLVDELGHHLEMEEVRRALQRGFEKAFSVKLVRGTLTSKERKAAQSLYAEKYSKAEWNFRRQHQTESP